MAKVQKSSAKRSTKQGKRVAALPSEKVMAKEEKRREGLSDPLGFSEGAKMALEQTHQAMDTYFDFLKKSISAFPSGGTEIGDRWKEESLLNLTAFQELVKRLSMAGSFEEALLNSDGIHALATESVGQAD